MLHAGNFELSCIEMHIRRRDTHRFTDKSPRRCDFTVVLGISTKDLTVKGGSEGKGVSCKGKQPKVADSSVEHMNLNAQLLYLRSYSSCHSHMEM